MNREHYRLVLDQITQHPETWDQSDWHCETTHCFAGWAQILSGRPADDATVRRDARIFLDLSFSEASMLFAATATLDTITKFLVGDDRAGYDRDGYDRDGLDKNNSPRIQEEAP